mmetsp:Transcript_63475/g.72739  ORF Transcript_63475/g.72739 Transcript_63475/m.72739 type:complete len:342 (-) Transcript_63475:85-1110(-)
MSLEAEPSVSTKCASGASTGQPKSKYSGMIYMLASAFCFFFMYFITKCLTSRTSIPSAQILAIRAIFMLGINGFYLYRTPGLSIEFDRKYHLGVFIRAIGGGCGGIFQYWGVSLVGISEFYAIWFLYPFVAILLGGIVLKEKVTPVQGIVGLVAFSGVLCVIQPGFIFGEPDASTQALRPPTWCYFVPLMAAFCSGVNCAALRFCKDIHYMIPVFYTGLSTGLSSLLCMFLWQGAKALNMEELVLGCLAAFFGALAQMLIAKGIGSESLAFATPISYVQVLFGFIADTFYFHHEFNFISILGGLIVFMGCILLACSKFCETRRQTEPKFTYIAQKGDDDSP